MRDLSGFGFAARVAPLLRYDSREPLPFTDVAVTALTPGDTSPSTGHSLNGPGDVVIEYALWCDMEIGHAYELEHVWVYATGDGRVVKVQGSAHGAQRDMPTPPDGQRPTLYVEPGKHGMSAGPGVDDYALPRGLSNILCGPAAGSMGVLCPTVGNDLGCTVHQYRQAWNTLRAQRFTPAWDAERVVDTTDLPWVTWHALDSQRAVRSIAAINEASADPVRVPVTDWGGHGDVWIAAATRTRAGELHLDGKGAADRFAEAQQGTRLLLVVARTSRLAHQVVDEAWAHFASAHTFIACPEQAVISRPATLAVPPTYVRGTSQLIVSPAPHPNYLTVGPSGDIDCPLALLHEHGWPSSSR